MTQAVDSMDFKPSAVRLLLEHGCPADEPDARGATAIASTGMSQWVFCCWGTPFFGWKQKMCFFRALHLRHTQVGMSNMRGRPS